MRDAQNIGLLLMVVSALSFGLTLHLVLTTDNKELSNWFVGSGCPFFGFHYNWFFGYCYRSFLDVDFSPFKSFYSPFPSVLGGIYFLICGIVFWMVETENPAQWLGCRNMRDRQCVLRVSLLIVGGVLSLCLSYVLMPIPGRDMMGNMIYPYQQWGFPLALLGIVLLTLGIVALGFVIIENRRLFQEKNPRLFQGYDDYLNHNYRKMILVWMALAFIGFGIISNLIDSYGVFYNLVWGVFVSLFSGGCLYLYFRLKDLHNKGRPEVSA